MMPLDKYFIKPGKLNELKAYIQKKYPDISETELNQVYEHAMKSFVNRHIAHTRRDIDNNVSAQVLREFYASQTRGIPMKFVVETTVREIIKTDGRLKEAYMQCLTDWLEENEIETHSVSERRSLIKNIAADESKSIAAVYALQKLIMYEQMNRLRNSVRSLSMPSLEAIPNKTIPNDIISNKKVPYKEEDTFKQELSLDPDMEQVILDLHNQLLKWLNTIRVKNLARNMRPLMPAVFLIAASMTSGWFGNSGFQHAAPNFQVIQTEYPMSASLEWKVLQSECQTVHRNVLEERLVYHDRSYNPFPYSEQNWSIVRAYLKSYDSLISESPYFEVIIDVGMEKNLDPRLLFAIIGQEQSFVKRGSQSAQRIANNPFNVNQSWQVYNTQIRDSAEIAANTVLNTLAKTPYDNHPLKALNRTYAEDPRWWIGVDYFYNEMLDLE